MRNFSGLAMACLGAAMLTITSTTFAEEVKVNIANGKNIFENGKPDAGVAACQTCHGEKALGNDAMGAPRLANIGYVYVVKQLTNFAEGKRTGNEVGAVMNGFAQALTEQERRDVAAYVNTLPMATESSDLAALKAEGRSIGEPFKGQIIVRYGVTNKVSACQTCHGFNGRGADPVYPRIAQQKYVYLVNQLTHWRDGSRANDPLGQMRAVAKNLTDEDINNVAAFLTQASDSTVGGGMQVGNETVLENILKH